MKVLINFGKVCKILILNIYILLQNLFHFFGSFGKVGYFSRTSYFSRTLKTLLAKFIYIGISNLAGLSLLFQKSLRFSREENL
jgi:hypothetical protein